MGNTSIFPCIMIVISNLTIITISLNVKITKLEQNIYSEEKFEEYDKTRSELEKNI